MAQNLFEQLQEKKARLVEQTKKAKEFGWIDAIREKEILDKIDNDVLTIGVIGQMKCGKSTFLNSFVFEDDVLPAATTPMTAALSVITYGTEKKIIAEFYTVNEWEEQKTQASRSLESVAGNTLEESKIKAAKELVERSSKLGSSLHSYLGKKQNDTFENLIEYVGAEGKFISITKSVTIYYPKEYLKGVEIVDTPGFNDPIVSREERTKAFLKKADVVLLMLYAGRPFDSTDRDILFKNVGQCGTGRVLIGINKYDIPFENGETELEIKNYVKDQLEKACKECNDNLLVDILKYAEPIPLSAEMALLSELPMSRINSNEAYSFAWKRNCETFEISGQPQMREKSHIEDLTNAVKKVVETEKEEILFRKPINSILAEGNKILADIDKCINENKILVNTYSQSDDELDDRQSKITKANRRLQKKIDSLGDDIEETLKDLVRKGRCKLEDSVEASCKKMDNIIDDLGRFSSAESIFPSLERETQTLVTRILKRDTECIVSDAKDVIKEPISNFLSEVEDVLMRFIPDFDSRDFIKSIEREIKFDMDNDDMFSFPSSSEDSDYGFGEMLFDFLDGASWGLYGGLINAISHNDVKSELHSHVNEIRNTDVTVCLESIYAKKDQVIEKVKQRIIDELINPLQEKIDEIVNNKNQKEQKLNQAKSELEKLQKSKVQIEEQLKVMMSF